MSANLMKWQFIDIAIGVGLFVIVSYVLLILLYRKQGNLILHLKEEVKKYEDLSCRDFLTNLLNRRGLRVSLETMLGDFRRGQHIDSISVVCIDLNDFKPINDLLGHPAGDEVLQVFANILSSTTRATDIVARTGGDEFLLVLPDISKDDVERIMKRTLKLLNEHTFSFSHRKFYENINLCFSYGVAATHDSELPFSELYHEAERKCEGAKKRDGKGR